ncbi:hypothetical protein CCR75_005029 [Bremia lactucae]|uniref:glucan endo-1,3-beta-D-glucosidase n=1 Tax=Bremia lactucae TaxID=4779 RepID=A0A976IEB9_BRELC|nr:hypothetical protein CCR75_005029 [Bremia lactucae]
MKLFVPLFASSAMLAAQVSANGVCYDPDHSAISGGMTAASVIEDIKMIKSHGFTSVRTYISKFGDTNLGLLLSNCNLTVALGVPYPHDDYEEQLDAAITAANNGDVSYIFLGNENLASATSVPEEMISIIEQTKLLVPDTVKVGTVQRNTEFLQNSAISGWSDLVCASDVLGVNIHPYFLPETIAQNAIDVVKNQWAAMEDEDFSDKLMITEVGWPSSGTLSNCVGSLAGLQTFYDDYMSWSSSMDESFYFQMFDTPYKTSLYEKSFGLLTSDALSKINFNPASQSGPNIIPNFPSNVISNFPSNGISNVPNIPSTIIPNFPSNVISNVPSNIPSNIIPNFPSNGISNVPSNIPSNIPSKVASNVLPGTVNTFVPTY